MDNLDRAYIAYYRVSTTKQGVSGLGLDSQRTTVLAFLKGIEPLHEFTDVESGTSKGNQRESLLEAIKLAKRSKAILVIAKLDRLARNVRFITTLMESGIEFVACDMPTANKFTIHIFAALAEQEAELISQRTKAALNELKLRGVKLGNPENLNNEAINKGRIKRKENAISNENNRKASSLIASMRNEGKSFSSIAIELNKAGFQTRRGNEFQTIQVIRLYERHTGI